MVPNSVVDPSNPWAKYWVSPITIMKHFQFRYCYFEIEEQSNTSRQLIDPATD
jgi:hypothetical protein